MIPHRRDTGTSSAGSGSRGLTLVEVMIALVVVGLLGAGMFKLLLDQHQFYGAASDRSYARETLRGSAQLVAPELRMVTGGDVLAAAPDSVAVRTDVTTGYVCHVGGSDNVYYYVYRDVDQATLSGSRGTAYSNPFTTSFAYEDGVDVTGTASSTAETECEARGAPADKPADRYRLATWSSTPVEPGAVLRVYRKLSYHFAPSDLEDGLALWRNGAELAGPFAADQAGFRYLVCTSGSCSWHTSVTSKSDKRDIRRIVLEARALGDGANRHDVALDLDYDITLRNYIED